MPISPHVSDEQLELYALGRLPENGVAPLEEHLLVCAACQTRLDEAEAFAIALRTAIASEPEPAAQTDWLAWLRQPAVAWVGAFALILVAVGLYINSARLAMSQLASLQLTAVRGEVKTISPARETDLTLMDLAFNDVSATDTLHVEVLNTAGRKIWSSALAEGDSGRIRITQRLSPDEYLVRLSDSTGRLLHEYAFRVQNRR